MKQDDSALKILSHVRSTMGPELIELLLAVSQALPDQWREWSSHRGFEYLRCRLEFTQGELALKASLTQSLVSRLEGGSDAKLSTWRKAYAAMGYELMLLPISKLSVVELEKKAEEGRPPGHWMRLRARPRRRWMQKTQSI